jgi:biotin synthase
VESTLANLARRAEDGQTLSRDDLLALVMESTARPEELIYWAGRVREAHFGRCVKLCSIVPGRLGACGEDCRWCAQSLAWPAGASCGGSDPGRRTPTAKIVEAAREASRNQAAHLGIVNSGRAPSDADIDAVIAAAAAIGTDPACTANLCASLGQINRPQGQRLAAAGFRRYHHNLETSRRFFPRMVSTHTYDDRLATLAAARYAGLEVCSGGILGLGESWDDRVDLALTLRDAVGPVAVPLNFLHPIPGTPLESASPMPPMEILCVIAIFRLAMPATDIKIAGGRGVNLRDLQSWVFAAGATSLMVGDYLTTTGRNAAQDLQMVGDLGLGVVGDSPTC